MRGANLGTNGAKTWASGQFVGMTYAGGASAARDVQPRPRPLNLVLLTRGARVVTSFRRGDVAERLKAAVC